MKPVLRKMTNKELMNSVLSLIESYGYHIKDKQLGSCYFLFEGNENSICHFYIKEIPGFRFALWSIDRFDTIEYQQEHNGIGHTWADGLDISPLSELVFFTQYERDIDKFKPSRSGFVLGLYRRAWEESNPEDDTKTIIREEWYDNDLEAVLHFMKHHHIKSAEFASCQTRYIWDYDKNSFVIFCRWIKSWYYYYKYRLKDYVVYTRAKCAAIRLAKKIKLSYVFVVDRGENWSPRLDVFIRRKPDIVLDKYEKEQEYIDKFEDKWFMDISVSQYDVDILDEDISQKDLDMDKDLYEKYKEILVSYETDSDDDTKIVYKNMKGNID